MLIKKQLLNNLVILRLKLKNYRKNWWVLNNTALDDFSDELNLISERFELLRNR